jgi:hypothetical protein
MAVEQIEQKEITPPLWVRNCISLFVLSLILGILFVAFVTIVYSLAFMGVIDIDL